MQSGNLNVQIVGDASKFNAEIEKTNQLIKNFRRQASKALTKGDMAGFEAFNNEVGKLKANLPGLERQLAQTGNAAQDTGRKFSISARSLRSFDAAIFNLGKQFGGLGIAAFVAYRALNTVKEAFDDQIERITKIRDLARETAQKPAAVAAAQNIGRAAGEQADAIDKMLKTSAEAFAKVQAKRVGGSDVEVIRGGEKADPLKQTREALLSGVNVMRGGQKTVLDLSDAFAVLADRTKKYKDTKEGMLQYQLDLYRNFIKVAEGGRLGNTQLNELAKGLTGLSSEQALKVLPQIIANLNAEMAKAAGPLSAQQEAIARLEQQQGLLANAWNKATEGMLLSYTELLTAVTKSTKEVLEIAATDWASAVLSAFSRTQGAVIPGIMSFLFGSTWAEDARTALSDLLEWMTSAAIKAAAAIRSAIKSVTGGAAAGDPSIPAMPMAAGGSVPGAGVGDTVPAMLTPGEFVQRRASVNYYGSGLMRALNARAIPRDFFSRLGFEMGGLVGAAPAMAFADGGAVGGGTPVHLHLGGHSFALSGAGVVVDALVTEAHRHKIRSAGTKPSWYGGAHGR